jgi:hypothetical protein
MRIFPRSLDASSAGLFVDRTKQVVRLTSITPHHSSAVLVLIPANTSTVQSKITDRRTMNSSKTPQDVLDVIEKLDASDQGKIFMNGIHEGVAKNS